MHSFAPFSNLKISAKNRQHFFRDRMIEFPIFSFFIRRWILHFFCEFFMIFFFRISRQIPEKSEVCRFSINFAKTHEKITEISENFENYSILFNVIQSCP